MNRSGNPEALHDICQGGDTSKKATNHFVNPGTPTSPLVSMEDRKTGVISGTATDKIRKHLLPRG